MSKLTRVEQAMLLAMFVAGVLFGHFDTNNHNTAGFSIGYALGSGLGYYLIFIGIPWLIILIVRGILRFWGDEQNYRRTSLKLALPIGFFVCMVFTAIYMLSQLTMRGN